MKLLLILRHPFFLKNFTGGVAKLVERGHEVVIAFSEPPKGRVGANLIADARAAIPSVPIGQLPAPRTVQATSAMIVSTAIDVLRYDTPMYASSAYLRDRARKKAYLTFGARRLLRIARRVMARDGYDAAHAMLMRRLDGLPPPEEVVAHLRKERPDAVIVSPVTHFGAEQAGVMLAARSLGIPVLYSMYSWDNLTNKGMLRPLPDAGIVWNESHRDECVRLHGLGEDRVFLSGAPGYDPWFETSAGAGREEFCRGIGLDPARPYVLYTCSSVSIAGGRETDLVERWIRALRAHPDPRVSGLGVLVRPHPQNAGGWSTFDTARFGNVAVHPRQGAVPFAGTAREEFYASIEHSMAVLGINTSAMVEAAVIDRPILALEDPAFGEGHLGTPHYRQLTTYEFLIRTRTVEENVAAIARLATGDEDLLRYSREGNRRFVEEFVRPLGREKAAAGTWADAVEEALAAARGAMGRRARVAPARGADLTAAAIIHDNVMEPTWKLYERFSTWRLSRGKARKGAGGPRPRVSTGTRLRRAIRAVPELGIYTVPLPNKRFLEARRRRIQGLADRGLVARVHSDGPFEPLVQLEKAFGAASSSPPSVLAFGDSVFYRVSRSDQDQTPLAGMLERRLGGDAVVIAGSAFHPRMYLALLRFLARLPHRPRTLVLPVNMRCFSPQWGLRPDYAYLREIAAAEAQKPGDPAPEIRFPSPAERETALAGVMHTPVAFPDSPLTTFGAFADLVGTSPAVGEAKAWRDRQIAIFHYLHPLEPGHPWLADLRACIALAGELGIRPFVYVTPINREWAEGAAPDVFADRFARNVDTLAAALAPAVEAAGGQFQDWSRAFGAAQFFKADEKTEHLCEAGRRRLAALIADGLAGPRAAGEAPVAAVATS